jgi:hypothetical protein
MGGPELELGEARRILHHLDRCIDRAREQHGPSNPLVTHYLQVKLATLLEGGRPHSAMAVEILATVEGLAELLFETKQVRFGHSNTAEMPILEFSEEDYARNYGAFEHIFTGGISRRLIWSIEARSLFSRFIYAVGPSYQFRYFSEPQPVEINITKKNDPSAFPFHPLLAKDFDLRVRVAGEISFIWARELAMPSLVYVNNVSGHYKPHWTSSELAGVIRRALVLDDAVDVIAIANDGANISGPIAQVLKSPIGKS